MSRKRRKTGKIIGISAGVLLIMILLLLSAAYLLRGHILERVLDRYNGKIPGTLSLEEEKILPLKRLPIAEIQLSKVILNGPADSSGMNEEVVLKADMLKAEVDLRELLKGNIRVPVLSITSGQLALSREKSGATNLERALGISFAPDTLETNQEEKKDRTIGLDKIELQDFRFILSDSAQEIRADLFLDTLEGRFFEQGNDHGGSFIPGQ